MNFTLIDPEESEPILDLTLEGPFAAGFQRVDLSDHEVRLEEGRAYQWFVAVVADPERRFGDPVARGSVRRVPSAPPLAAQIAAARPEEKAAVLAAAGIWYDALANVADRMPDRLAETQRDALLAQVGIKLRDGR